MGIETEAIIIDDELDICILLSGMLKKYGIKASFATTLKEGLGKLKNSSNMILFLDNSLPDGSGLESLTGINENFPELNVVMISAYDGDVERRIAFERGAKNFIGKPLTRGDIIPVLKAIFPDLID